MNSWLFIVAPGDTYAYTILGTFLCTYVKCTYSKTQHLDRFYGCCCENKVWHWVFFHTPHPTGSRTRHLWNSFHQLLVLASIGSGISRGNSHTLCMPYSLSLHHVQRGQCSLEFLSSPRFNPNHPDLASQKIRLQESAICSAPSNILVHDLNAKGHCLKVFPPYNLKFLKVWSLNHRWNGNKRPSSPHTIPCSCPPIAGLQSSPKFTQIH